MYLKFNLFSSANLFLRFFFLLQKKRMPPKKKQSVLDLSKSRRHTKQIRQTKTVDDDTVGKIGGSQTSIQCNPLQSKSKWIQRLR